MLRRLLFVSLVFLVSACADDVQKGDGFDVEEQADAGPGPDDDPDGGTDDGADADDVPSPCARVESPVDFGPVQVGRSATQAVVVTNCATTGTFSIRSVAIEEAAFNAVVVGEAQAEPGETITINVTFAPSEAIEYSDKLRLAFGEADAARLEATVRGVGTTEPNACVETVAEFSDPTLMGQTNPTVSVLSDVALDASATVSMVGQVVGYEWSIVSRPQGSNAMLSDNSSVSPTIFVDRIGTYVVELSAFDSEGYESCEPARLEFEAVIENASGFHIQLTWETPTDPDPTDEMGVDLDLHWRHALGQWNTPPYDCFWDNFNPDWGPPGPVGNPSLDIDDTTGGGLENVNHEQPESGVTYSIGVYLYNDRSLGETLATVSVFESGQLIDEFEREPLNSRGEFWHVANVTAPNVVTAVGTKRMGFP